MVFLYLISKGCENMGKNLLEQLKQEYAKNHCPAGTGKTENAAFAKTGRRIWKAVPGNRGRTG